MDGKLDICNRALAFLGQEGITSFEDTAESARRCRLFYDACRREILRAHEWGFAVRLRPLALLKKGTEPLWPFVYAYPQDALFVCRVFGHADAAAGRPWREISFKGRRALACAIEEAHARYICDEEDPARFDPLFSRALALALAADLCLSLTGDYTLGQNLLQQYARTLDEARRANMTEWLERPHGSSVFVEAR